MNLSTLDAADDTLPTGASLTAAQQLALDQAGDDPLLDWLIPLGITAGLLLSWWAPWGFARV